MADEHRPRWTEPGSDAPAALRQLLREEQADAPSDTRLRELATRIAASIDNAPIASAKLTTIKLAIGLAMVLFAGAALWLAGLPASRDEAHKVDEDRNSGSLPPPVLLGEGATKPQSEVVTEPAEPVPPTTNSPAPPKASGSVSVKRSVAVSREQTSSGPVQLEDELELLRRARLLLVSSPQRALDVVAQHMAGYRDGTFAEEREAIAIEALIRLGDTASAQRRARDFARRFPRSAYQRRITALLAGP